MQGVLSKNIEELESLLSQMHRFEPMILAASELVANALERGNKLLACGNGGSAADASHLTTEFVVRFNRDRRPYPAMSLTAHGGDLTAIGNDYDFRDVFARQVLAFAMPRDILIAFSTSGHSENLSRALLTGKAKGMLCIAFLGRDGGVCKGIANIDLIVESSTTARIQEVHKLMLHTLCELVELRLGH